MNVRIIIACIASSIVTMLLNPDKHYKKAFDETQETMNRLIVKLKELHRDSEDESTKRSCHMLVSVIQSVQAMLNYAASDWNVDVFVKIKDDSAWIETEVSE